MGSAPASSSSTTPGKTGDCQPRAPAWRSRSLVSPTAGRESTCLLLQGAGGLGIAGLQDWSSFPARAQAPRSPDHRHSGECCLPTHPLLPLSSALRRCFRLGGLSLSGNKPSKNPHGLPPSASAPWAIKSELNMLFSGFRGESYARVWDRYTLDFQQTNMPTLAPSLHLPDSASTAISLTLRQLRCPEGKSRSLAAQVLNHTGLFFPRKDTTMPLAPS